MRSSATLGTGQLRLNVLTSAIVVISGAGAFRRYHGSAQRILRRALHGKSRALARLLDALQDQPADALGRFQCRLAGEGETPVRIVFLESSAELKAAGRNLAQPTPLPRGDLEDFHNRLLRRAIPFPPYGAGVLVLDLVTAFFEL